MNDTMLSITQSDRNRAMDAVQGHIPFDVLIKGGQVADVITGELRLADVGLSGKLIASVHTPSMSENSEALHTIDAQDAIVCPGLIDMHMHIESSMITPAQYSHSVLPRGITTAVWDPHELANVSGEAGFEYALRCAASAQMRLLTLVPSCVPSAPGFESTGGDFSQAIVEKLLSQTDTHGVAEVMSMQAVLDRTPRMSGIVQAGLDSGKRVCGHARGLTGSSLNAYVAAGIETDHELTSAADLLEKLYTGMTIEMRGSHDHLLPEFVELLNKLPFFPATLTLCTDDVFPNDLLDKGGLDDVIRRLVRYGLPPLRAIQAATLNAATQLGRRDLGLIAPGRRADIAVFDNLYDLKARQVVMNGELVSNESAAVHVPESIPVPVVLSNSMNHSELGIEDFQTRASGTTAKVATIMHPRFTQWGERVVSVKNGVLVCPDDLIQMAVVNRFAAGTPTRLAFLENWGQWNGVFASTVSHDSHNLTLFGSGVENFALAANTVRNMNGGLAVVANGEVLAELSLPLGGLMRDSSLASLAADFDHVVEAMDQIVQWQPPLLVFKACFGASLVCNAGPHLSDKGIVDSFSGEILQTPVSSRSCG